MRRTPKPAAYIPTIVVLLVLGWSGLLLLMTTSDPLLGQRWLFFVLIVVAFTGVGLPAAVWLNHRFPSSRPAGVGVVVRQGLWVGVFAAVIFWLAYGRVLNFSLALIFLVGFTAIEFFIRLWERSQRER